MPIWRRLRKRRVRESNARPLRAAGLKPASSSMPVTRRKAGELRLELRAQVLETCRLPLTNSPEMPKRGLEPLKAARAKWVTATRNCRYPTSANHGIQLSNNKRSESFRTQSAETARSFCLFIELVSRFWERESAPADQLRRREQSEKPCSADFVLPMVFT